MKIRKEKIWEIAKMKNCTNKEENIKETKGGIKIED